MANERKDDLTAQIVAEIIRAIMRLGGDPKLQESPTQKQLLDVLRQCGADRYLIGTVASWNDTIEDAEVLDDLKRLNSGKPYFDHIFATRKDE